jgi:GrxC family glutaredoxin
MNIVYSTQYCPWCQRAKGLLDKHGIEFTEVDVTEDVELQKEMIERSGRQTVPQIFFGDEHIGGFEDLVKYLQTQNRDAA